MKKPIRNVYDGKMFEEKKKISFAAIIMIVASMALLAMQIFSYFR